MRNNDTQGAVAHGHATKFENVDAASNGRLPGHVLDRPARATEPDWFSITHLPERQRVLMRNGASEFMGWMALSRRGRPIFYRVGRDGRAEQLEAHAAPSLWRPQNAATWPWELPERAVVQPEPAPPLPPPSQRRKGIKLHLAGELPLPWAIEYAPAGKITLEHCEARLLRALKTDRFLPDRERAQMRVRVYGLETAPEPGDWPKGIELRWAPFPEDSQDYLVAMRWYAVLDKRERTLVRERAMGWSFLRMGDERGRSDEWARQQYIGALTRAWRTSNEPERAAAGARSRVA